MCILRGGGGGVAAACGGGSGDDFGALDDARRCCVSATVDADVDGRVGGLATVSGVTGGYCLDCGKRQARASENHYDCGSLRTRGSSCRRHRSQITI